VNPGEKLGRILPHDTSIVNIEFASLEIPIFHSQKMSFAAWFSKVVQAFACYNLGD